MERQLPWLALPLERISIHLLPLYPGLTYLGKWTSSCHVADLPSHACGRTEPLRKLSAFLLVIL